MSKSAHGAVREQVLPLPVLETQVWALCAEAGLAESHEASATARPANSCLVLVMTSLFYSMLK
jgi:hypothetical protein